jgi:hypothetical protein
MTQVVLTYKATPFKYAKRFGSLTSEYIGYIIMYRRNNSQVEVRTNGNITGRELKLSGSVSPVPAQDADHDDSLRCRKHAHTVHAHSLIIDPHVCHTPHKV